MPDAGRLLSRWRADPSVAENIVTWEKIPARPADWVDLPDDLHPELRAALAQTGIDRLYSHQAEAWDLAQAGTNLAIVTATASGKTLGYNLPVLDELLRDPQARALYLFPTKALAQDQLSNLVSLGIPGSGPGSGAAIYDGDTPASSRSCYTQDVSPGLKQPGYAAHRHSAPPHLWAVSSRICAMW